MKEATGELSMTAVVVVVLGILAVALPAIIKQVTRTMEKNANCSAAYGCTTCNSSTRTKECWYDKEGVNGAGSTKTSITCGCDPNAGY